MTDALDPAALEKAADVMDAALLANRNGTKDYSSEQIVEEVVRAYKEAAAALSKVHARPLSEWHEDIGDVIWWRFPIEEPPYIGTPLDFGQTVEIEIRRHNKNPLIQRFHVGGWPGYHTHWTPLAIPAAPSLTEPEEPQQ